MDRKTFIAQCMHQHSRTFEMASVAQPQVKFEEMDNIYFRMVEVLDELWAKLMETGVDNPRQVFVASIPVSMHNRWLKVMKDGGWEYSKKYNGIAKFHPDIVEFGKLCQYSRNRKINECLVYLHSRWLWESIKHVNKFTLEKDEELT